MESNILRTIEDKLPGFSKGKQQIASYILDHPNDAAFQTAAEIGKAVKISESTVVRFASDLGYKGFPEFQKTLRLVLKSQLENRDTFVSNNSKTQKSDPYSIRIENCCKNLQDLLKGEYCSIAEDMICELSHCQTLHLIASPVGQFVLPYCKFLANQAMIRTNPIDLIPKEALFSDLSQIAEEDHVLAFAIGNISDGLSFALKKIQNTGAKLLLLSDHTSLVADSTRSITFPITVYDWDKHTDLTQMIALLSGIFSLIKQKRENDLSLQKIFMEELEDAYENYDTSAI